MDRSGATANPLDEKLVVLSHQERRRLLAALLEESPRELASVAGDDLATHAEQRKFLIELHHRHLPKLEDNGAVQWDREEGVVARGPVFDEIRPLVEQLVEPFERQKERV